MERQAEDRSHRMGQTMPVTVYIYSCRGTIEQRIQEILREKQALFNMHVDHVSLDIQSALGVDEMFALFGLNTPVAAGRVTR